MKSFSGHFRITEHCWRFALLHVQHWRLQILGWNDPARAATAPGSLHFLLRTNQPQDASRLLDVAKGEWRKYFSVSFGFNFAFPQFARQYSRNDTITFNWLCTQLGWPFSIPKTILDLVHLEAVFDVLDLYLWFSYRFMDIFPDGNLVRDIQKELDEIIQQGVFQITKLLKNSESSVSSNQPDEDVFSISQRKGNVFRSELKSLNYKRW